MTTKKKTLSRRDFLKFSGSVIAGTAVTGLVGLEYSAYEVRWYEVTRRTIPIKGLPSNFEGFTICHLTDIHFDGWTTAESFSEVVDLTNPLNPDVIAITGDIVSSRFNDEEDARIVEVLGRLEANTLTCATLGNHDHWLDEEIVRGYLSGAGISDLSNTVQPIKRGDQTLYMCGLDDYWERKQDLKAVTDAVPEGACAVLLMHEPDYADFSAPTGKFALQLSGHSHGGQVNLPLVGRPILPQYAIKYPVGLYNVEGMYVYTSRGIGMTSPRVRINCRPEIALLTLTNG